MSEWLSTSLPTPTVDHRENLFGTSVPAAGETFYLEQAGVVMAQSWLTRLITFWLVGSTLWKILVSWDYYSQYMEKTFSKPPTSFAN